MLVRVTNQCSMKCIHCMVDASPNGKHMSLETFEATLGFIKQVGLPLIMISGGEPTDHPDLLEMLPLAKAFGLHTILLSNGEFLHRNGASSVLDLVDGVQVTNDKRYYSREVSNFVHPKVTFERQIRILSPFGRAVANRLTTTQKYPGCFNIRSTTQSLKSIRDAYRYLSIHGKFCAPSIDIDGTLRAGETPSCEIIGTVFDSEEKLRQGLYNKPCNNCGLVVNINKEHCSAVGL